MSGPGPSPGEIGFADHALPALAAGSYEIEVTQSLTRGGVDLQGASGFQRRQRLRVEGPRFGLAAQDVHAVYPPANSAGDHIGVLPHVVLRRRGLPWAIDLLGDNATRGRPVPWLALVVLHPGESAVTTTGTFAELLGGRVVSSHRLPDFAAAVLADASVPDDLRLTVVDLDATTFAGVLPAQEDLPWTAHVRTVNTEAKELLGQDEDGCFSVLIANRVPAQGENRVHLVSLEGWAGRLPPDDDRGGGRGLGSDARPCRLISLASWSFTSAGTGSFESKMAALDVGTLTCGRPEAGIGTGTDEQGVSEGDDTLAGTAAEILTGAIRDGYVPLRYDMRHGEQSVAWYRGPLTPVSVPRIPESGPRPSAEAGLVYHPGLGMFDASYAVAWQLGRLLALSDGGFSAALMRWRRRAQAQVDRLAAEQEVLAQHVRVATLRHLHELADQVDDWRRVDLAANDVLARQRADLQQGLTSSSTRVWDQDGTGLDQRVELAGTLRARLPVIWTFTAHPTLDEQRVRVTGQLSDLVLRIWAPAPSAEGGASRRSGSGAPCPVRGRPGGPGEPPPRAGGCRGGR